MMKPHTLAAILLATALAGCVQDSGSAEESESPAASGSGAPTDASPSDNATEPAPAPNSPPTANLTSDVVNGSVPLNVTFVLSGEDADGDNLSWSFDADGDGAADANGTELPANFTFSYTDAGNYTAVLNVTDGEASANATLLIVAEAGSAFVPKEDNWARWDELGMCHAKGTMVEVQGYYWHERNNPADPPGTGYPLGGGTWIYEESNGVDGLQIGGPGEADPYTDCQNPDTLIF